MTQSFTEKLLVSTAVGLCYIRNTNPPSLTPTLMINFRDEATHPGINPILSLLCVVCLCVYTQVNRHLLMKFYVKETANSETDFPIQLNGVNCQMAYSFSCNDK